MIKKVLVYLRKRLDDYLCVQLAEAGDHPVADKVVFFDGDKMDPISFQDGNVVWVSVSGDVSIFACRSLTGRCELASV